MAQTYGDNDRDRRLTNEVVTLWYRAPELLLGAEKDLGPGYGPYGPGIDLWSCGCIFAELMLRRAYLKGVTEVEQLSLIFHLLGQPDAASWPDHNLLPKQPELAAVRATISHE
jgi:serine/threonine protein kinase